MIKSELMASGYFDELKIFSRDVFYRVAQDIQHTWELNEKFPSIPVFINLCHRQNNVRETSQFDDPMYGRRPQDLKAADAFFKTVAKIGEANKDEYKIERSGFSSF